MTIQLPVDVADAADMSSSRILDALRNPILVIDAHGEIAYANAAAADRFGGWIIGSPLDAIFPRYLRCPTVAQVSSGCRLTTGDGELYEALSNPMEDGGVCLSLWPATPPAEVAEPVRADDLTGLALRGGFMAELATALEAADRPGGQVAILCLDLDRFKMVNDTLGHGIGDQLLAKVADRLRTVCRKEDMVARLGGDEFVILQRDGAKPETTERLAARLVDLIGRTYVLAGHSVNIGASVGVAISDGAIQPRDLLRRADLALYEAKRAGRGRFRFFEPAMDIVLHERRELEIDLRRALALRQFALHYQPFLDVTTHAVIGFEALLRWNHPTRGEVAPLGFIPVAEENGIIVKIGEWVLNTACATAATWPGDLVVAVNVSPTQFKTETLLATVTAALRRAGLPPERLEIEITESVLLADTDNVLATLHALRDLGVRISMDDFGTGYSSLSYLQKFPFSKIKIDRSFVAGSDADSDAILTAVSSLGASLGMSITAEGVETAEQLDRIRDRRCTHVQGYLTGRPMQQSEVAPFLSQQRERDTDVAVPSGLL